MGLGKTVDIGVRLGVGGWAVESPKLEDQIVSTANAQGSGIQGASEGETETSEPGT